MLGQYNINFNEWTLNDAKIKFNVQSHKYVNI